MRRLQHGLIGRQALVALRVQREVHHQNGVFLHDADEQNDADDGDHREVMPGGHQRQQRADAGRGQGGQNGDRVDVALIQHAQHDIHGGHSGEQQPELVGQRRLKGAGRALEGDGHRGGQRSLLGRLLDRVDRFAQRHAGRELEGNERRRKLAQMVDGQRRGTRLDGGDGGQRNRLPVASREIHAVERAKALVGLFFHAEHHAVLRRLGEDGRHQPLAEGVVQRAVDRAHADAQARGRAAVHVHISLQALVLQIAGHAGELRQRLEPVHQRGVGARELRGAGGRQAELIGVAAGDVVDGQVLHRLQIGCYAFDLGGARVEPVDEGLHPRALFQRLEVDEQPPGVHGGVHPVDADHR